jgi:type IV secretory pathway VirB10-like protein
MAEGREEKPQPVGLNRKNILIAAGIGVALIAGSVFVLMEPKGKLVDVEPRVPRVRSQPERLVERLPPPPPIERREAPREPFRPYPAPVERPREQVEQRPQAPPRRSLYQEALRSPVTFPKRGSESASRSRERRGAGGELEGMLEELERQGARLADLAQSGGLLTGGFAEPAPPAAVAEVAAPAPRFLAPPTRPYLSRGTVIPGQLVTAIHSDLPGQILGTVVRDVLDSGDLGEVVIPKGSKLLGRYDSDLVVGQNRVLVVWDEIQFPDGGRLLLPEQSGIDGSGASGLSDRVNHHTARILGQAALLSLVGAGFELARPESGSDRLGRAVSGASYQLEAAAAELLRRNRDIQPTVKIRQGTPFGVFVRQQIEL